MSERPGVQCCPAMKENSDQKYIVKILSMPASQVQLDALLVTGAYKDPAAALDYFRQQADDTQNPFLFHSLFLLLYPALRRAVVRKGTKRRASCPSVSFIPGGRSADQS